MAISKQKRVSLIELLLERGLFASRDLAERSIRAGQILVNEVVVDKPNVQVRAQDIIRHIPSKEFVGRGALKLTHALKHFEINCAEKVCADVGSSTGGFTEVLLNEGAKKVFAIDVGYGELDYKLRTDARVVVMERTNARYVESLPEVISLVTIDVSFISLKIIIPAVSKWISDDGIVVALVKPQFEAKREEIGVGGIVTDPSVHERVVKEASVYCQESCLDVLGSTPSPILGGSGNKEFLIGARRVRTNQ